MEVSFADDPSQHRRCSGEQRGGSRRCPSSHRTWLRQRRRCAATESRQSGGGELGDVRLTTRSSSCSSTPGVRWPGRASSARRHRAARHGRRPTHCRLLSCRGRRPARCARTANKIPDVAWFRLPLLCSAWRQASSSAGRTESVGIAPSRPVPHGLRLVLSRRTWADAICPAALVASAMPGSAGIALSRLCLRAPPEVRSPAWGAQRPDG